MSKCSQCIYRAPKYSDYGCDYLALTGQSRGCGVEDCTLFIKGRRLKTPLPKPGTTKAMSPGDRDYSSYMSRNVRRQGAPIVERGRHKR